MIEAHAHPALDPPPRILVGAQSPGGVAMAARIGDGWAAEVPHFGRYRVAYLDALDEAGRRRGDVRIVVGFGGGRTGVDALSGSPWVERPADAWAELREEGADEVIVTARTQRDIELLVTATDRW